MQSLVEPLTRTMLRNFADGLSDSSDKHAYLDLPHSDFAERRLRILDKNKKIVPFIHNRAQSDLLTTMTGRDLVLKARQLGVSTAVQGMLYQEAVTGTATTMTLAHDDDGTQKLRRIADRFFRNDPAQPRRGAANARLTTYPAHDSEVLIATAGNRTSGRAATLSHLHGSEVAFWPDAESIISGAGQAGDPRMVLESTPNGAQGYFYSLCMEALDGSNDWRLHFYPWWWDETYCTALDSGETLVYSDDEEALIKAHDLTSEQIKWRRAKQRELKHLFAQEYPEDVRECFLRSGLGYFGDLSGVFSAPTDSVHDGTHRYVAGLDFGQANDFTDLPIMDATESVQVDLLRLRGLPWAEMRRQIVVLCVKWNVSTLVAEKNSMGGTNIEALRDELEAAGAHTKVIAFDTTNTSKQAIIGNLHAALHERNLKLLPDQNQRHEFNAFTASQSQTGVWRLSAPDGEHDDTVIGAALMWRAATISGARAEVW